MKDVTGQRFGRLVAVRRTDEKNYSSYIWECACDCGTVHFTSLEYLLNGGTKSCGCLRSERMASVGKTYGALGGKKSGKDILGQRFGRLEVIKKTDRRDGNSIVWLCRCDCGAITSASGYNLRKGFTQSCGCLRIEKGLVNIPNLQKNRPLIDGTDIFMISKMDLRSDNKTGVRGVSWDNGRQCYRAMITFKGKSYYLGRFNDLEKAKEAREIAEGKMFGEFLEWYYETFPEKNKLLSSLQCNN